MTRFSSLALAAGMLFAAPQAAGAAPTPLPCASNQTQTEMTLCAQSQASAADAALNASYRRIRQTLPASRRSALTSAETAWIAARDQTCAFEAGLTAGGTISPMEHAYCIARMSDQQTQLLNRLSLATSSPQPVLPAAAAELSRTEKQLRARLSDGDLTALTGAQHAWLRYRSQMCALVGGNCLSLVTAWRTRELKAGWVGEPFWT